MVYNRKLSFLGLFLFGIVFQTQSQTLMTEIPKDKGLPLPVKTGVNFVNVESISENDGTFQAVVDIRFQWQDLRLKFTPKDVSVSYHEYTDSDSTNQFSALWIPTYEIANAVGAPTVQKRMMRIFPDGRVEIMERITGAFTVNFDVERFPFDTQELNVDILAKKEKANQLNFVFNQDELQFSSLGNEMDIQGWTAEIVNLSRTYKESWYGQSQSVLKAALVVRRKSGSVFFTLFLPLIASLLIPLLAIWLNRYEENGFAVDGFELANIVIGGLFAVVALNFTVNSSYIPLSVTNNTIMQLFGLNYLTLAISFAISIVLYRFHSVSYFFNRHFEKEFYLYLNWAIPLLVYLAAVFIILYAMF